MHYANPHGHAEFISASYQTSSPAGMYARTFVVLHVGCWPFIGMTGEAI